MAAKEILVPDIGDFKGVPVIEILVKPGDAVKAEDALITLESDKATMEIPSPHAGRIVEIKVAVGDNNRNALSHRLVVGEAERLELGRDHDRGSAGQ